MTEVAYKPLSMSPEELTEAVREASRRLYDRWTIRRKFIKTWRDTGSFRTAMWARNSQELPQCSFWERKASMNIEFTLYGSERG